MSDLWIFVIVVLAGIALGYVLPAWKWMKKALSPIQITMLFALMFLMGLTIGQDPKLKSYIFKVGLQAFVMTLAVIAGSVTVTVLLQKIFFRRGARFDLFYEDEENGQKQSMLKLALMVLLFMLAGYLALHFGRGFVIVEFICENNSQLVMLFLCVMIFAAGLEIGLQKNLLTDIKRSGWAILLVPSATLIGSIAAAMIVGFLLGIDVLKAGAAGSACGWYTLSGIVLSGIEPRLGALAFLLNLFREMLTPLVTPFISKRFGPFAAVCPAGATSMDTMLSIITRSTSPAMTIIAFANGVILSSVVPAVLSLFISVI